MFDLSDPKMFWLNITNIMLGVAVLVCCVTLGYGIVQEVLIRIRKSRTAPAASDDHAFHTPDLGVTMADGGKRIDSTSNSVLKKKHANDLKRKGKEDPKH
jgi:hypothetical protein